MGQVAHRTNARHARPAFEGVHVTLQRRQRCQTLRLTQPALQGLVRAVKDVDRLFQKDGDDFVIHRLAFARQCACLQMSRGSPQLGDVEGLAALTSNQARGVGRQPFVQQPVQRVNAGRLRGNVLARGQLVEHVDQRFVSLFGFVKKTRTNGQAAFFHCAVQVKQGFAQGIDGL